MGGGGGPSVSLPKEPVPEIIVADVELISALALPLLFNGGGLNPRTGEDSDFSIVRWD